MNDEHTNILSEMFGPEGEAVPEVDPEDVRAVWREYQDMQKRHPGVQIAITTRALQTVCGPGADMKAICYRHAQLGVLQLATQIERSPDPEMAAFQEKVAAVLKDNEPIDSAFTAVAKVPMIWAMRGLPYDFDEFLRLCAA